MSEPIIQMRNIEKHFGSVIALAGVTFDVWPSECHCLLGDNGAGKSTFIKTMSGVYHPTKGDIYFEGKPLAFADPRDAMAAGIATVHQHLAMIPLMSVARNFFLGNEPVKRILGIPFLDRAFADGKASALCVRTDDRRSCAGRSSCSAPACGASSGDNAL